MTVAVAGFADGSWLSARRIRDVAHPAEFPAEPDACHGNDQPDGNRRDPASVPLFSFGHRLQISPHSGQRSSPAVVITWPSQQAADGGIGQDLPRVSGMRVCLLDVDGLCVGLSSTSRTGPHPCVHSWPGAIWREFEKRRAGGFARQNNA